MKPIRLLGHARENMRYRGATEEEVVEPFRLLRGIRQNGDGWSVEKTSPMGGIGTADCMPQNRFGLSLWRRLMRL